MEIAKPFKKFKIKVKIVSTSKKIESFIVKRFFKRAQYFIFIIISIILQWFIRTEIISTRSKKSRNF